MRAVDADDTKIDLTGHLEGAVSGEGVVPTVDGVPAVQAGSDGARQRPDPRTAVDELLRWREEQHITLGGLSLREMIEAGRQRLPGASAGAAMKTVGAYEAKTHLPRLLDEVANGETITITKHGVPVARLVPASPVSQTNVAAAIEAWEQYRDEHNIRLGDLSIKEMIEEGRM